MLDYTATSGHVHLLVKHAAHGACNRSPSPTGDARSPSLLGKRASVDKVTGEVSEEPGRTKVNRFFACGLPIIWMSMSVSLTWAGDASVPTIGLAVPVDRATDAPYQSALRKGLQQLGYVDGKNIKLVFRYADGSPEKLRSNIKELIALQVDVLYGDARLLKEATRTIPIVSPTMGDPVRTGLVASLAHPGANLTGLSAQSYDLWPKQLELAKELVPRLVRVGFLFDTIASAQ